MSMSSPSHHPLSLSFLLTLLLLLATAAAAATFRPTPLVKDICNQTSSYSLCVQALYADPQTATTTNEFTMLDIAFRLANKHAGATYNYISGLMNKPHPALGRAGRLRLGKCRTYYESVSYDMLMLSGALNDETYAALAFLAREAAGWVRKCEAAFSKSTWQPMGNRNQVLVVLCQAIEVLGDSIAGPGEVTRN